MAACVLSDNGRAARSQRLMAAADTTVKLNEIPYSEFPTISFSKQESIEMPFREYSCPTIMYYYSWESSGR